MSGMFVFISVEPKLEQAKFLVCAFFVFHQLFVGLDIFCRSRLILAHDKKSPDNAKNCLADFWRMVNITSNAERKS